MKLCDFCGFYVGPEDIKCRNCSNPIPGRQVFEEIDYKPNKIESKPNNVTEKIIYQKPKGRLYNFIRKSVILLILTGIVIAPQTQTLVNDSLNYWDEMNKPYYNIPESIELTMVRNFTIYLQDEGYSDYSLVISKPEDRPTWPQQGETSWQSITDFKTNPDYNENEAGRMEWANRIEGQDRDYIEIEYKVKINTLRPDLTPEDSGTVEDIPEGYDIYLQDEWLIEPSSSDITNLSNQLSNGTEGNVIKILQNIYNYITYNYTYKQSSIPKSCDETMENMFGDCDDFSILFASIARAAGIPAWLELGRIPAFIDNRAGCDLRDWGGHAWVNTVVPLKEGGFAVVNIDLANSYFMWMPAYRISDWVDDGNGDNLYSYYYLFSSKGTAKATYLENSYVSNCEIIGNLKLEQL
tara:strand:+ start:509 stop:1735 length:1227 start_codon:yes stop_codon:yes gene_type:complete